MLKLKSKYKDLLLEVEMSNKLLVSIIGLFLTTFLHS